MAKRNPKPLRIRVTPSLAATDAIKKLIDKGHDVVVVEDDFDMILSERAWRMTEELTETAKLVEVAVTACRAVKYRKVKKDKDDELIEEE